MKYIPQEFDTKKETEAGRSAFYLDTVIFLSFDGYGHLNASLYDISDDFNFHLKLYCGYLYTRICMINCVWGLKTTMTTGEWSCLISFAWDPLSCSEQAGIEKFKMKIYVSSGIRTHQLRATTSDTAP